MCTLDSEKVNKASLPAVGGINASSVEMIAAGVRVPLGFTITTPEPNDHFVH